MAAKRHVDGGKTCIFMGEMRNKHVGNANRKVFENVL